MTSHWNSVNQRSTVGSGGSGWPVTSSAGVASTISSSGTGGAVEPRATATPDTAPITPISTAASRQNRPIAAFLVVVAAESRATTVLRCR
jgi:hypothetical protein